MQRVAAATATELFELKPVRRGLLVLSRYGVALLTVRALQNNVVSSAFRHFLPLTFIVRRSLFVVVFYNEPRTTINDLSYSTTSDTVPAPTVRPPSRIANRSPFSMAIGAISVISIWMLSPGITISTPAGRFATPVTSVVLK